MSIDKVRAYFITQGNEERILEFDVSSATVELEQYSGFEQWVDVCKGWA